MILKLGLNLFVKKLKRVSKKMREKETTRTLDCNLSEDEIIGFGAEIAANINEVSEVNTQKKNLLTGLRLSLISFKKDRVIYQSVSFLV